MRASYLLAIALCTQLKWTDGLEGAASEGKHSHSENNDVSRRSLKSGELSEQNVAFPMWVPGWYQSGTSWAKSTSNLPIKNAAAGYHGQDEEDKYAFENFFYKTTHGTYLEMGALDGVEFSNTLYLQEAHGWHGLLIEANPTSYGALVKNRPDDVCLNVAICATSRVVHFVDSGPAPTTGIYEFMPAAFLQYWHPGIDVATLTTLQCHPLSAIFGKLGIENIDFWSLDVEGGELEVLRSIDFDVVKVGVFAIEADEHNPSKNQGVIDLLVSKGYTYHGHVVRNDWFLGPHFVPVSKTNMHSSIEGHHHGTIDKHAIGQSHLRNQA